MPTDVVVQGAAGVRLDPHRLRRPGARTALLVSSANYRLLEERGQLRSFNVILVTESFTAATIASFVREFAGPDLADCRLSCQDEDLLVEVARARESLGLAHDQPVRTPGIAGPSGFRCLRSIAEQIRWSVTGQVRRRVRHGRRATSC